MTAMHVTLIGDPRVVGLPIEESGDPLVDLRTSPLLRIDPRKQEENPTFCYVRDGVARRLLDAHAVLPEGLTLLLVEGFRPMHLQAAHFDRYREELRAMHPAWTDERIRREASRYVSPPDIVPPHVTGGAMDLTLATADGQELDMGTRVNASPEESVGACYTAAPNVSHLARANRRVLGEAMTAARFVNYPTEWWHWSYGDRYWAYAVGGIAALFGAPPEPPET